MAFTLCFATGLLSHIAQHWTWWPTRPVNLYRVTQGVHVLSGIAAVPLLLVKLWSVYPKLFVRPALGSATRLLDRLSLYVLIGAAFFQLATGLFNSAQSYPWRFTFVPLPLRDGMGGGRRVGRPHRDRLAKIRAPRSAGGAGGAGRDRAEPPGRCARAYLAA
ncbi:hypothetical protein JNW88_31855, partial [Micromonospora sp. ATA32]|nr:hypothetical protein [Micromonospora sp. ATA32]